MPNWCNSRYCFYVTDIKYKDQIDTLYDCVTIGMSKENPVAKPNRFGDDWLGNILAYATKDMLIPSNTSDEPAYLDRNGHSIRCSGCINEIDVYSYYEKEVSLDFSFSTETAWAPNPEMWTYILDCLHLTHVKFVYVAEEPGCEVYINTDTEGNYFTDKWYLDCYLPKDDSYDYESAYFSYDEKDDLLDTLNSLIDQIREAYISHSDAFHLEDDSIHKLVHSDTVDNAISIIQTNIPPDSDAYIFLHEFINI